MSKQWRGLVIDAQQQGNIARFMNCCWGRDSMRPCDYESEPERGFNVEAECEWSRTLKRPVVVLYATKEIDRGEGG